MLDPISTWLREQRLARGWSVAEMGRQLQKAARSNGDHTVPGIAILAAYVRRWEKGAIGLTERYQLHYCAALGIPPAQFGPPPPGRQPGNGGVAPRSAPRIVAAGRPGQPADQGGSPADSPSWLGEEGGYRGSGPGYGSSEWPEESCAGSPDLLIPMIAEESLDFGEWADTSNVGDATLERYAGQVRQIARDYVHASPYPLLLDVKRLRDRVFAKLQGHQRPDQTRDLYLVGSQVCGMLAWMSGDLGFQSAGQSQTWAAWVCAEHADHDGARAWVRAAQSKLAYWDGRYVESAELAQDGLRYIATGSVPTLLAVQMARALARAGRADDANRALDQARTEHEQASGEDNVGGAFGLTDAQYHYMAGTTHLWRHDPGQAIGEAEEAIALFEASQPTQPHYGPEALTRIDQACAYLQQNDLDGAVASLEPVLSLPSSLRLELLTQNLASIRQTLTKPEFRDAAVARELQEQIETYGRESIVRDLRG